MDVKVSVIMPAYNSSKYLGEAIESLTMQSLPDFEVIVVDDGSTDDSVEIVERYAAQDDRVRLVRLPRSNAGAARNAGMRHARGTYVIFLDADDVFDKDLLRLPAERLDQTGADICLFNAHSFYEHDPEHIIQNRFLSEEAPLDGPFSPQDVSDRVFQIINPAPWTKIYRLSFIEEHGLRYQSYDTANDLFFTYASLTEAGSIVCVDKSLLLYRMHAESSQHAKKRHPLNFVRALLAIKARLIKAGTYDLFESSFVLFAMTNYNYNLHAAHSSNDIDSLRALAFAYADYASFELGIKSVPQEVLEQSPDYPILQELEKTIRSTDGILSWLMKR